MASSAGYASRLSTHDRKGVCGLPELFDTPRSLSIKIEKLVQWIQEAQQRHERYGSGGVVVLTGAGISTSAGIPDFRGPNGIWTKEKQQKKQEQKKKTVTITSATSTTTNRTRRTRSHDDNDNDNDRNDNEVDLNSHLTWNKNKRQRTRSSSSSSASNTRAKTTPRLQDWSHAKPTFTHYAITKLIQPTTTTTSSSTAQHNNKSKKHKHNHNNSSARHHPHVKFCITQNVDGLHRRSGLSRSFHAILHGCAFTETCETCHTEYFHDFDVGGMSFAPTGRFCTKRIDKRKVILNDDDKDEDLNDEYDDEQDDPSVDPKTKLSLCGGTLRDTLLDWHDELPEDDFDRATRECETADLAICLGTSLRIEPAGSLPTLAKRFVIVNLQETPKDAQAAMIIRARVDDVMRELLKRLGIAYNHWEGESPMIERTWTPPIVASKKRL